MKKDLLILGANPFNKDINHAGGQLTAITNLIKYIEKNDISYDVIDIFRSTFPKPPISKKILMSWCKYRELKDKLNNCSYKGAIVFASYGFGYWEKLFFALTIEKYNIKTLFFIRSGHFMQSVIDKEYRVPIKRFFMNKISYIGYQGGNWEAFYLKFGIKKEKLIKILNWIEIKKYKRSFNDYKVTFLYVGWMVEKKGVNELVDVILENSDLDKFNFIFVGGGTLIDSLVSRVKKLNRDNNIKFTGWLNHKEVERYYKEADVLVLPSHAEGFPNVILEALNYRLPIISTNVGAISESVIDNYNGFLINVNNKQELFDAILKLGSSKKLRQKFSQNSEKVLLKNHSIEKNCKIIFDLFEG